MAISTLTIDINARMASLEKDLGKVARLSEQSAGRMNAAFKGAGTALAGVFAGVTFGAAVAGFRSVTDQIDALNDAADATGSSIENLSGLEDLARRTGAGFDSVVGTLVKFNAALKDADGKNGASQALKAIGLDAAELRRIDPAEALQQTAVALSKFADDGNKARIVQELFGKSIREAAPFLKDLAESGQLNATVTSAQAAEAEKFNKQLFALQTNLSNVGRSIVSDALPALNKLFDRFNKGGVSGALGFDKGFLDKAKLAGLAKDVNSLNSLKESFATGLKSEPYNRAYIDGLAEVTPKLEAAKKAFRAANDEAERAANIARMDGLMSGYVPRREVAAPSIGEIPSAPTKTTAPKLSEAQRYIDSLKEQVAGVSELSAVERARFDLNTRELAGATEKERGVIMGLAAQKDANDAIEKSKRGMLEVDRLITEMVNDRREVEEAASAEAQRYFEASLTPAQELERTIARINELYDQGAFGADGEERRAAAIGAANEAFKAQDKDLMKLNDSAREFSSIMLDAIKNGGDLGKALEQIALKAFIFDPLSKALDGLFSGMGGGAGGSGGFNPLSLITSFFGGFFADGGSPPVGKVSVVGERGPELFIPKAAGTIIPNGAFGGSVAINQNITIGEGVSANGVMAAMVQAKEAAKAEVIQILRGRGMPV